jgi:hypothetical protein
MDVTYMPDILSPLTNFGTKTAGIAKDLGTAHYVIFMFLDWRICKTHQNIAEVKMGSGYFQIVMVLFGNRR